MNRLHGLSLAACVGASAAVLTAVDGQRPVVPRAPAATSVDAIFENTFDPLVRDGRIGAAAAVVVENDRLVFHKGWGIVAAATKTQVDPAATLFAAASTSKLFVATAVMQLVDQGLADLDADIRRYVPNVRIETPDGSSITLRQLLTHTAGVDDQFLGSMSRPDLPLESLDGYFTRLHLRTASLPGAAVSYSNRGMALAGYIVERVSGRPFFQYVEERIFAPLNMRSSSFRQPLPPDLAARRVTDRRGLAPFFIPYPAASLVAPADDMGRFVAAHLHDGRLGEAQILSERAVAEMHRTHWQAHPGMPGVAIGFFESRVNGRRGLFHTGDAGHHSLLYLLPEAKRGFYAVFAGTDENAVEIRSELARKFTEFYPGTAAHAPASAAPSGAPGEIAGVYRMNQYSHSTLEKLAALPQQIRVVADVAGLIRVQLGLGGSWYEAQPAGDRLFRVSDGTYLTFQTDAAGRIRRLSFSSAGVGDPGTADRIAWYDDARLHLALGGIILVLFVSRGLVGATAVARRLFTRDPPRLPIEAMERLAWTLSGVVTALLWLTPVVLIAGLLTSRPPYTNAPWFLTAMLAALLGASAVGVSLAVATVVVWVRRSLSVTRRIYLSLLAVASCGLVVLLAYWNLLGFRY